MFSGRMNDHVTASRRRVLFTGVDCMESAEYLSVNIYGCSLCLSVYLSPPHSISLLPSLHPFFSLVIALVAYILSLVVVHILFAVLL